MRGQAYRLFLGNHTGQKPVHLPQAGVVEGGRSPDDLTPSLVALVLLAGARAACLLLAEVLAQRGASRLIGAVRSDLTAHLRELGPARIEAGRMK